MPINAAISVPTKAVTRLVLIANSNRVRRAMEAPVNSDRFNCQTARPVARMSEAICGADSAPGWRFAYPGHRQTRVIAPCVVRLQGSPVVLVPFPRRGVRNDRAFHRARGARMVWDAGSPHAVFATAPGQWPSPTPKIVGLNRASEADLRLRSARGWILRLAACPRGCRWRRRAPVRASCRPDMHLDRPPVLPASVPVRFLRIGDPHCVQGPAS